MLMPRIYGNASTKTAVYNSIRVNRLPQAIILEGDDGSGRMTLAREIAAAAVCLRNGRDFPCGECKYCRRIREGITPDIVTVRREEKKTQIGVDAVRSMAEAARNGPCELPMLIFIIEDADTMTVQAQNAWLLTLENPPEDVAFILLCENERNLLETVRSRAPTFRMQKFEPSDIVSYLRSHPELLPQDCNDAVIYECATASGGSIGKCAELCDPQRSADLVQRRESALEAVRSVVLSRGKQTDRIRTVYKFPENREDLKAHFRLMSQIMCDLILLKKDERAHTAFFTESKREEALEMSDACSTAALLGFIGVLDSACDSLSANASVKGVRTDCAISLGLM
jgi:DNA polymerase-3 subunit delta'